MSVPLVSVIIPCYNAEKFVEKSVYSIMQQTYKNLEIIVIDDCSTDSTSKILDKLSREDDRIVYIQNEKNLKLAKTLNKGIALANGNYIARMDADDISDQNRIEKQVCFMEKNDDIDIVGTNLQHIDHNGTYLPYQSSFPLTHTYITNKLAWKATLAHPSILAKKSFFTELNGFDESLLYAEDYELWIRAWLYGKRFANLSEPLLLYRIHNSQMTDSSFNKNNAKIISGFLYKFFIKTRNIKFIFGCLLQTKISFFLIRKTSFIRQYFRK